MIPSALWNACYFVLQFSFTFADVPRKMNTAADFSSSSEMDPTERIISKNIEDITRRPIELKIESTCISQEEPVFFDTTNSQETTEKENWKHKRQTRSHTE